ncbi:hypothetical protein AKJ16_DCAP17392 [Drosera capensis]
MTHSTSVPSFKGAYSDIDAQRYEASKQRTDFVFKCTDFDVQRYGVSDTNDARTQQTKVKGLKTS